MKELVRLYIEPHMRDTIQAMADKERRRLSEKIEEMLLSDLSMRSGFAGQNPALQYLNQEQFESIRGVHGFIMEYLRRRLS